MEWKRGDGRTAKLLSGHLDFSSPLSRQNNARFQLHRELTRFFQSSSRIKPTVHCPRHDSFQVSTACYLLCVTCCSCKVVLFHFIPCSSNLPFQSSSPSVSRARQIFLDAFEFGRLFICTKVASTLVSTFHFRFERRISLIEYLKYTIIFRFAVIRLSQR